MTEKLSSLQNPRFKEWLKDIENPDRQECGSLAVEGIRQIRDLSEEEPIELLLGTPSSFEGNPTLAAGAREKIELTDTLIDRLSQVRTPQKLIAFFQKPSWDWTRVTAAVLYLDGVRDPGNLGTLFRTAAATGIFSIVTGAGTVSCYNDKVVRSSSSYLFRVPFLQGISRDELVERGYQLWTAEADKGLPFFETPLFPPLAIVLGNEGSGVSPSQLPTGSLHIPMVEGVESLNVGVSGSLLMYEVYRRQLAQ